MKTCFKGEKLKRIEISISVFHKKKYCPSIIIIKEKITLAYQPYSSLPSYKNCHHHIEKLEN